MNTAAPMAPATAEDAPDIAALRDELAHWMLANDIQQWKPGEYPPETVAAEIARGEWFIWRDQEGALIATVRLIWRDPEFWGAADGEAGYVHGLMVTPAHRGKQLGSRVLEFCAERTLAHGLSVQRLDTAENNAVLREFYAAQGFTQVGTAPLPARFHGCERIVLLEKRLGAA
ncbi:GNAT family N-acetyltransferase [Nocardia cyriacigeorgica]|uniref:GNAT family N-acetyltransferase n=1 Tax=Nocardia cyriacigeorgica TaxID=135487 RepID=UPI0018956D18|nr:GNAT family N-acetyltransferase [Nocardia cyriacigeorgica]MBF6081381.1 GNAT family N-acetyltransferase [Nocardia cyriacigeorgica]